MNRHRGISIAVWSGVGIVAALSIAVAVALLYDWNGARPWLNARLSEAAGRKFEVRGDLSLVWRAQSEPDAGWRGWIPWPVLRADDVALGNPPWSSSKVDSVRIGEVDFSVNPLLLFQHKIVIPVLRFDNPKLVLERAADGRNNWTFEDSDWRVEIDKLVFAKGSVHVIDAIRHADVTIDLDTLDEGSNSGFGFAWKAQGTMNKEAVSGSGRAGGVLSLRQQITPYPIEAVLHAGKTAVEVKGTLTNPGDLAALDMRLKLSGASMAQLYPLSGLVLPETPPYATEGHLTATLGKSGSTWTYDAFRGTVGSSDLAGTLTYLTAPPRPLLTGTVVSKLLQLKDLAPVIGADTNASKVRRDAAPVQPAGRILPREPFKVERWNSIDADVKITGVKVLSGGRFPIENMRADLHLKDGVVSLTPLSFGVAGGVLDSTLRVDSNVAPPKADIRTSARGLKLRELFPNAGAMQDSAGDLNGDATLSASGDSVATLLASSNGSIRSSVRDGTVSKMLLEQIGLNVGSVVLARLFGDRQVRINCVVGEFDVAKGLMRTRNFVADTEESVLVVTGQINLADEQLALLVKPTSKGMRIVSLTTPISVTGTFESPNVSVDKGMLAMKTLGAVVLGAIAPLAALIPVTTPGKEGADNCARLLAAAKAPAKP